MRPGLGLICLPGLEAIVEEVAHLCDFIEVEPQPFWIAAAAEGGKEEHHARLNDRALQRISDFARPLLVHSVGYPIGGTRRGAHEQLDGIREALTWFKPPWWSEHLNFLETGTGDEHRRFGFLMPPIQSMENVSLIVDRVKELQDLLGLPFAFETGTNYLRPVPGEIPDGAFWAEIADRAECGILLDLHNVWTNAQNGRQCTDELISQLPPEHVWEMHLAAGQERNGFWLDSHSGLPSAELATLATRLLPRFPHLRAVILEIIPEYFNVLNITSSALAGWLSTMHASLEPLTAEKDRKFQSNPRTSLSHSHSELSPPFSLPSPAEWERELANAVDGLAQCDQFPSLSSDPGVEVYRDMISAVRRGMLADNLSWSLRYIWISLGELRLNELLAEFWRCHHPERFPADEAANFAAFLEGQCLLPHLKDLLALELGQHRASVLGINQYVRVKHDPSQLFAFVANPQLGAPSEQAEYEIELAPQA